MRSTLSSRRKTFNYVSGRLTQIISLRIPDMNIRYIALLPVILLTSAYGQIVDGLPAEQQESGIVTKKELQLSQEWFDGIAAGNPERTSWIGQWVSSAVPFSFQYGGADSATLLK